MTLIAQRGEKQEYRDMESGKTFFSVTQVRRVAFDPYVGIPESVLEPARVRGMILHRRFFFALASLEGLCPYPTVYPLLAGYCQSMDQWIEKRKPIRYKLETPSCNPRYGYAGTPDALVGLHIKVSLKTVLTDLKTGSPVATDAMQLVSYSHMDGYKADELLDIYLDADGGFPREVYVSKGKRAVEWAAFLNALNILKWRNGQ